MTDMKRRTVLKVALGGAGLAAFPAVAGVAGATSATAAPRRGPHLVGVGDTSITLEFDDKLRSRVALDDVDVTRFDAGEALLLGDTTIDAFTYRGHQTRNTLHPRHGAGVQVTLHGDSKDGVRKTVELTSFQRLTGMIVMKVTYTNISRAALKVTGWRNGAHELLEKPGGFYTFSGTTHEDRRDWVQPVTAGFAQQNSLGMDSSDYGGGTPMASVWRQGAGLSVGHVEPVARILRLPVRKTGNGASIAIEGDTARTLKPGQRLTTDTTFLTAHPGDHFGPLQRYRDYMGDIGQRAPKTPKSAFDPIWCAWGYERGFTVEQVVGTLPKVREVGLEWAGLDDGWQTNEGDWDINLQKFPRGEADMRAFTKQIRDAGLRPRLWWAPLAADPESNLFAERPDMLLLDRDGNKQRVTWWNAWTLCPAYKPTVDYFARQAKKFIRDWGYEGLKIDGQHLNGVTPCYNPAHRHARPEESTEGVAQFWKAVYEAAHEANRDAVVELCPCGTAFAFHNLPYVDQYPASDPESSYQVRHKGKTMKALMGPGSSYAGDHVELSDGGDDFASSYGVGAVLSTKFTYPAASPDDENALTPEREVLWRKWVDLYKENMLPTGEYRGELYDIGFDKPEAHVVEKGATLHYAFYADQWNGTVELRGLGRGRYRLTDPFTGASLGTVDARHNTVKLAFEKFQLIVARRTG
ncbi:glycoside hydrolase family 36 protein [Actinomadura sp. HBU206391]|uniref:glycoside hydrolase family 36 protein n=1 Tax=Actinomadura sp. HBU206391 TaxID=2731692 RepID=UPI00164F1986|nr:glycoside hydrolase family 36 protein [Actinomadura sp. HBU206391]MBC6462541.1 alpha-galactosidase [Actinomadura sp. HBU206391]